MKLLTPAVVLIDPKYPHNVAAAIRGCSIFGAKTLLWTGDRVRYDKTLKTRLPREERMKGYANVTVMPHERPIDAFEEGRTAKEWANEGKPNITPVCIEIAKGTQPLDTFDHPENPVYIFGPEDGSVPGVIKRHCFYFVHIPRASLLESRGGRERGPLRQAGETTARWIGTNVPARRNAAREARADRSRRMGR